MIKTPLIEIHEENQITKDSMQYDIKVFACPKCREAWEILKHNPYGYEKYNVDFPKIGLKKRLCPKCEALCR